MKTQSIALSLLTCALSSPLGLAVAQDGPRTTTRPSLFGRNQAPSAPATRGTPGTGTATGTRTGNIKTIDGQVFAADAQLPEPIQYDQIKAPTLALPPDAIEPYLLTKDNGPFMVMAKSFRGPEAERFALALVLELRRDYGLPAYILRIKDFPNGSNIRNVPPTAPEYIRKPRLTEPEKVRSFDEAAVLVGDEKTLAASEALWKKVVKIKPKCLNGMPKLFYWREGLASATRTTNPFVPAQNIFPGKQADKLVHQMNGGPRSIYNCPSRYTLMVAEFGGRSIYNPTESDPRLLDSMWLKKSPLLTAADDAEKLADTLAKDPEVKQTGCVPYVYHDRTSSKVMLGAFNDPRDPTAVKLRDALLKLAVPLADKKRAGIMIAPGNSLTDLEDPNQPIKTTH